MVSSVDEDSRRVVFVGDIVADAATRAALSDGPGRGVAARELGRLIVGNLEVPLCEARDGRPATKGIAWRAPKETVGALRDTGVRAVNLANNHSVDWGRGGLLSTLSALEADGIAAFGAGQNSEEAYEPWIDEELGLAVFGVSCTVPPGSASGDAVPGMASVRTATRVSIDTTRMEELPLLAPVMEGVMDEESVAHISRRVAYFARKGYAVVVSVHWGTAWSFTAKDYQFELSEALVDAGASLIVGHHTHTLGSTAYFQDALVCFGLGDWIRSPTMVALAEGQRTGVAEDWELWSRIGLALVVEFHGREISHSEIVPVMIDLDTGLPQLSLSAAERSFVAGLLEWLGRLDCSKRHGWRSVDLIAGSVTQFPTSYR